MGKQSSNQKSGRAGSGGKASGRGGGREVDRKALQLCRQVERTLGLVLSGELNDDRVRDLMILSVTPAPRGNHMLVTLQTAEAVSQEELLELDAILASYNGQLRAAIAADIHRRKTPEITLRVVNP